jgi:Fe2+ transport system protein FeoA
MVTRTEAGAIDDWRYANRIPTRAEAMRRLIRLGILSGELVAILEEVMENYDRIITAFDDADPEQRVFVDLLKKGHEAYAKVQAAIEEPLD